MTAMRALKDTDEALIESAAIPERLLPVVVIYGANASGKSNVLAGLRFLTESVANSQLRADSTSGTGRIPFRLDPRNAAQPSALEIDFVLDGTRYHYGFEATDEEFSSEWLYAFPSSRRQMLFERRKGVFSFGRSLLGRNRVISDLTKKNSLFLSAASQLGHERLSKIAQYFRSVYLDEAISVSAFSVAQNIENVDERIVEILKQIGTGAIEIRRKTEKRTDTAREFTSEFNAMLEKHFPGINEVTGALDSNEIVSIEVGHRDANSNVVFFPLERESAGTRRLLLILSRAFRALDQGTPFVVDELDASLHTKACELVVSLFSSRITNSRGAQLIATTHDTNLLSSELLRRDQIWFTEKGDDGATRLYPLTDIKARAGENLERGYLQGRYGAVPFSGTLRRAE